MGVGIGRQVERLETVAADALGLLLGRQLVPQLRVFELGRRVKDVAAGHVQVAGEAHEHEQRAGRLERVVAELVGAVAPDDAARRRGRVNARRPGDFLGVAPGDLGDLVEGVVLDPLP